MDKKFDLLTLGQALLRLSPVRDDRLVRGDTLIRQVGGAELNVAVGASLLGLKTGVITKLPSHEMGAYIKNTVRSYGISDDYIIYDSNKDARVGIYFYENGAYPRKPNVIYDRKNSCFETISVNEFPEDMYKSTTCFHTTGITLALCEKSRETAIEMIKKFKENGSIISFDVNFRANLWSGEEARETIEKILPFVDIFFCSEDTARLTFGKTGDVREIMKSFTEEYPISIVASTQRTVHSPKVHDFGSVIYNAYQDKYYTEKPYKEIDVVDRIGSGDAYIAGTLYGLLHYRLDCEKALAYGNAYSAVKNTIPGDVPSSNLSDIDNIIADHNMTEGYKSEMNR